MALGWLALLKTVPWSDVISAAPTVAGGARNVWDAVRKKPGADPGTDADPASAHESIALRLEQNEAALAAQHAQMLSAFEIITKLADQNTLMVAKIEAIRVRLLWVSAIAAVALLTAAGSLIALLR